MLSATCETLQVDFDKKEWCGDRKVRQSHSVAKKTQKSAEKSATATAFNPSSYLKKLKLNPIGWGI